MDRLRRLLPLAGLALLAASAAWFHGPWAPAAPPSAEQRLGARKLRSFCLSCHVLDGPMSRNPLAPRVRGWTRAQAYERVAHLDRLSSAMILNFQGTDEERWALAGALERLGKGERP